MKKTKYPLVSIIIPTHNRSPLLKQAILSVFNQSYKDFEIIVVDDGSKDETRRIVKSIADKKIIYLYQKNNGRSAARNKAIAIAQGKYLAFLDDDDLFLPGKLSKQVKLMEKNPDCAMSYTSALTINEQGEVQKRRYLAAKAGNIYHDIAFYLPLLITLPTVVARRDVVTSLNGFDEKMTRFEDTDFSRRIAKRYQVCAIREPLAKLRTHEGNQMEHPLKLYRSIDYYTRKIFREDREQGFFFLHRGAANLWLFYALALLLTAKNRKYFFKFCFRSLSYYPPTLWMCRYIIQRIIGKIGGA